MRGVVKLWFFLLLMFTQIGFSQSINLQDAEILPAPLGTVEESAEGVASFVIQETNGVEIQPTAFGGLVNVTISVDLGDYIALKDGDVSLIKGVYFDGESFDINSFFDVEYLSDDSGNTLEFKQKAAITADFNGTVYFPVVVIKNSPAGQKLIGFQANITATDPHTDSDGDAEFYTGTSGVSSFSKLDLIKSIANVPSEFSAGTVIDYNIKVINSGDEVVSNIKVTDPGATIIESESVIEELEPGQSVEVKASYTLTQSDIDSGSYTNTASVLGDSPDGEDDVSAKSDAGTDKSGNPISSPLEVDSDEDGNPENDATVIEFSSDETSDDKSSMTLIKSVTSNAPYRVGSSIVYELVVTNTGETTLTNIEVTDLWAKFTSGNNVVAKLEPGESATLTAYHTVTQFDLDKEGYKNQAEARGDSPSGKDDVSVVSDAGTDEYGNIIIDPLTVDGMDEDGDPTNDATYLNLNTCFRVYNEFSPNGDGINEYFKLKCIENYPDNTVEIFNRWGNLVYKVEGYNNQTVLFVGRSKGRVNMKADEELPTGTYFYMIDLGNGSDVIKGWLYLNR